MTDPTSSPACACGNPETTHDRHGHDACAACRLASRLLAAALVSAIDEMARDGRDADAA